MKVFLTAYPTSELLIRRPQFISMFAVNSDLTDYSNLTESSMGDAEPVLINNSFDQSSDEEEINQILETRNIAYGIIAPIIVVGGIIGNLLTILILRLPQFKGIVVY